MHRANSVLTSCFLLAWTETGALIEYSGLYIARHRGHFSGGVTNFCVSLSTHATARFHRQSTTFGFTLILNGGGGGDGWGSD